jgi:hypothetical protein
VINQVWLVVILAGWIAVDAMLFHDYQIGSFVAKESRVCGPARSRRFLLQSVAGWYCVAGLLCARSGLLAAGTLAGLAGLTMLELHCPNFRACM